jgi:hypothetical protein
MDFPCFRQSLRRSARRCLPLFLALAAVGCGRATGDVSGTVTYKGTPVAMGSVVLVGSDGIPHSGEIQEDGTYEVTGVPAGTVSVGVLSRDPGPPNQRLDLPPSLAYLNPAIKGPKAEDARRLKAKMEEVKNVKLPLDAPTADRKKWRRLPKQYENPSSSGLTMKMHRGENTQDIMLE